MLDADRYTTLDYADFTADPAAAMAGINQAMGYGADTVPAELGPMPLSRTTVSAPQADKWKRHEAEITALWPMLSETQAKIEAFCAPT